MSTDKQHTLRLNDKLTGKALACHLAIKAKRIFLKITSCRTGTSSEDRMCLVDFVSHTVLLLVKYIPADRVIYTVEVCQVPLATAEGIR